MSSFALETELWEKGFKAIAGVDEVGRGPIAGPVVTSAVVFPFTLLKSEQEALENSLEEVDDSKALSPARRRRCLRIIRKSALAIAVSHIPALDIDRMGIGKAVTRSMALSIVKLLIKPDYLLIDGIMKPSEADYRYATDNFKNRVNNHQAFPQIDYSKFPARTVVKGDSLSLSISAASIVAKVTRDRLMSLYSLKYPGYGFAEHKGYGTAKHLASLANLGATPLHRFSFSPLSNEELFTNDQ